MDGLRADLSRVQAMRLLGRWGEATALAVNVAARARQVGYGPVLALALLAAGSQEVASGDVNAGIDELYETTRVASQSGEDRLVAAAYNELVFALGSRKQRFEAADVVFRAATAAAAHAGNGSRLLHDLYNYRGHVLTRQGDHGGALAARLFVLALAFADHGPDGYVTGLALCYLASTVSSLGHPREAGPLYDRGLAVLERQLGPEHPWFTAMLSNAARNHLDNLEYEQASAALERVLALRESSLGPDDPAVAASADSLGHVRYEQGRYPEARALAERAVRIRETKLGPEHPAVADSYVLLGAVEYRAGEPALALTHLDKAIAIQRAAYGDHHERLGGSYQQRAAALLALGRVAEARAAIDRASAIDKETIGEDSPDHSGTLEVLATVLMAERRFAEAAAAYRQAEALVERELGADSPALAHLWAGTCDALLASGAGAAARDAGERAVAVNGAAAPGVQSEALFCLARAELAARGSRSRALSLAREARARLAGAPSSAAELARIDGWLAAPGRPAPPR